MWLKILKPIGQADTFDIICRYTNECQSIRAISEVVNISKNRIRLILIENGISIRKGRPLKYPREKEQAIQMIYADPWRTQKSIAVELQVPYVSVQKWFRDADIFIPRLRRMKEEADFK